MASRDDLMKFLLEDDAKVTVQDLGKAIALLNDRMEGFELVQGPKSQDRMFRNPFQQATVNPGQNGQVFFLEVPRGYAGVVLRIGNDWFPNTFLSRHLDANIVEGRIERVIAPVTDPMSVKLLFFDKVIWTAQNNDAVPHTFGVLTDGFWVRKEIAKRIAAVE